MCFCSFLGLCFCTEAGIHLLWNCSFIFYTGSMISVTVRVVPVKPALGSKCWGGKEGALPAVSSAHKLQQNHAFPSALSGRFYVHVSGSMRRAGVLPGAEGCAWCWLQPAARNNRKSGRVRWCWDTKGRHSVLVLVDHILATQMQPLQCVNISSCSP